jgi:hypothetical protein
MGDLGNNPIWSNLENSSTDMMGPAYSYSDNIPGPSSLGVGSNGTFGQISTNLGAVTTYVKGMVTGDPPLGNRFFVNTGGTCTATDGSVQSRYNFINNIPGGGSPPAGLQDLSFLSNDLRGLIPGIMEDVEGLDPYYLFTAMTADGTPPCDCYTCDVTSGGNSYFLTTSLSPDFDPALCTKADVSKCKPAPKESFSMPGFDTTMIPTLLAAGLLLFLAMK